MLNGLDLFSGIGGISLALEPWVRSVAYCEQDPYCQGVLLSRMREGALDAAPIWDDVRTLTGAMLPPIDIIFGGFPCQDISVAGKGGGLAGERSGLFFEIVRIVEEIRPSFIFLENVPAIRTRGLSNVLRELAHLRYDCRWTVVSAGEVGAAHLRQRWFLLASNASCKRVEGMRTKGVQVTRSLDFPLLPVRNSYGEWEVEPDILRTSDGVSKRVDRIKALGNSVVPQAAREAFIRLSNLSS